MNKPEFIVLHHSATSDGTAKDFTAIRNYHMNTLGWSDIGYHWIIEFVNGVATVIAGRDEKTDGGHTKQQHMNYRSIGICVVGNYDKTNLPSELYQELIDLIRSIRSRYGDLPLKKHSDYAVKTCPELNFPFEQLIKDTSGIDYEDRWSTENIEKCLDKGLMSGYPDGSFKPTQQVTREELATVIVNILDLVESISKQNF